MRGKQAGSVQAGVRLGEVCGKGFKQGPGSARLLAEVAVADGSRVASVEALGKVAGKVTGRLHQGSEEGCKEGPGQLPNKAFYKRLVQ